MSKRKLKPNGLDTNRMRITSYFFIIPCLISPALSAFGAGQAALNNSITSPTVVNKKANKKSNYLFSDEIIVTAQKREQDSIDVPITLSVISDTMMADLKIDSWDTLSTFVPGVNIQEQSVDRTGFMIRGMTSDDGRATSSSRISIYQDGVSINRFHGANVAMYDLERIEVLKGPQGTLFGRGAEIGAISIIQNKPKDETSAQTSYSLGNFNSHTLNGYYNTPLVSDKLLGRVAYYYSAQDGYIDNKLGCALNGKDTQALRVSLGFNLEDESDANLILNYQKDSPPGVAFESFFFPSDNPFEEVSLDAGNQLGIDRELIGLTGIYNTELTQQWQMTLTSAYREFDTHQLADADGLPLRIIELQDNVEHEQWSQEARFNFGSPSADDQGAWRGFVGINLFVEQSTRATPLVLNEQYLIDFPKLLESVTGRQSAVVVAPPIYDAAGQPNAKLTLADADLLGRIFPAGTALGDLALNPAVMESSINEADNRYLDLFGDAGYDLTTKLRLTMGLRVTYEDVNSSFEIPDFGSSAQATVGKTNLLPTEWRGNFILTPQDDPRIDYSAGQYLGRNEEGDDFIGAVGRLVVEYKRDAYSNIFMSYARGRKPQAINYTTRSDIQEQNEEIVDSWELGFKQQSLNRRHAVELGLFYYDFKNFETEVGVVGIGFETDDKGRAHVMGTELSGRSQFSEHFSLLYNLNYIDARMADEAKFLLADNHFRLTPQWSSALSLRYDDTLDGWGDWYVASTYAFQSNVFFEDDNDSDNGLNHQNALSLLNFVGGVKFIDSSWDLLFYVKNALDKEYIIDAGNAGSSFGISTFVPGPPRMLGASVTYRY